MADIPASSVLEAEADGGNDDDSAFGDDNAGSSTTSIGSSILRYRQENGRTYHAYKDGQYLVPNDEREQDRMDLQHHLFTLTFDGKLFTCPISRERQLHRVLDIGTGTGIWAIDFADEHPESQVYGIDLSPIQPAAVPPNVIFVVDDLESPWTFSRRFDFIHSRMMTGSIADWPRLFGQCFENLNPGGYIEVADMCFPVRTDDDSIPTDSDLRKWSDFLLDATTKASRPINSAELYKSQLQEAGFTNVVEVTYKWPVNTWPKNRKFKELGMWSLEDMGSALEGFSLAPFTRVLGWSREEVEVFLVNVRKELKNPRIHAYWSIYVVYGQKPVERQ